MGIKTVQKHPPFHVMTQLMSSDQPYLWTVSWRPPFLCKRPSREQEMKGEGRWLETMNPHRPEVHEQSHANTSINNRMVFLSPLSWQYSGSELRVLRLLGDCSMLEPCPQPGPQAYCLAGLGGRSSYLCLPY
jgi:hypothetical protein